MKTPWPQAGAVFKLFALLFSNRWVSQWKKQWARQQALLPPAQDQAVPKNKSNQKQKPDRSKPMTFYERNFTLRVTLWYLLFQRLSFDATQAGVVADARKGGADRLGKRGKKKLSQRIGSSHTSSYNEARQRLPLALVRAALACIGQQIQVLVGWGPEGNKKPALLDRCRQLMDGSTVAVLTTPELAEEYPPARVRSRLSDWCLMRIVVGFCARSGAVLSAIEGPTKQSEQRLAWQIMAQAARWVIWIGDRNFGVWSVVAQAVKHEQDVLVRLTRARAKKLMGPNPLRSGEERLIDWAPSRHDQAAPGTEGKVVRGRLIYVRLHRGGYCFIDLWLFTTLEAEGCPVELLVQWYGQRWQAEVHFRSVKTHLHLAELHVESPEMARKEFYAALLAYNLVRAVMWGAGENLEKGVQTLSFSNARRAVLEWLKDWGRSSNRSAAEQPKWVKTLLDEVGQQTLPKRKRPRPSQPRMVRCRATHWPILKGSRSAAQKRHLTHSKTG
jgi:Transposase DDE domain